MATKIVTKNSSTAGAAPTATDLVQGELAVNVADGRLYTEDNAAAIVELGVNPATEITANAGIALPDSQKATFGAGDDLQIYHDGTDSFISDQGTGNLKLLANDFRLANAANNQLMIAGNQDGAVTAYYSGSAKLATTTTGIDVTGTATMDGLTVDGDAEISSSSPTLYLMESDTTDTNWRARVVSGDLYLGRANDAKANAGYSALFDNNGDISFYEATGTTAKFFWDASAESLGIGTSSPTAPLHVSGSTSTVPIKIDNTGTGGNTWRIWSTNDAASDGGGKLGFYNEDTTTRAMTIDSSGNVGIGVTSPSSYTFGDVAISGGTSAGLTLVSGTTGIGTLAFADGTSGNAAYRGYVQYSHSNDSLLVGTGGTERFRIDSSGNVGIGTSSPATKLHVQTTGGTLEAIRVDNATVSDSTGIYLRTTSQAAISWGSGGYLAFYGNGPGNAERARIDSSGNLLVGKTSNAIATAGVKLGTGGSNFTRSSNEVVYFNRTTNDGDIATFAKDGTAVGSIGGYLAYMYIGSTGGVDTHIGFVNGTVRPATATGGLLDNTLDLGSSSARWQDIYATNGTIQTSDRNEKQDIAELSDAEQRVAVACKGLLRKFRWKDSVAEKGDEARTHFGIIAQDLQAAFEAEGLDAGDYAMFISTTWTDEETNEEKTRMGVRYSELLAFIIAAI